MQLEWARWSSGINAANAPYTTYREATLDKSLASHCL